MKMIIRNTSKISDMDALVYVIAVLNNGLSGDGKLKQHCHATTFNQNGIKITVICRLNKSGSETFYVMNYYLEEEE